MLQLHPVVSTTRGFRKKLCDKKGWMWGWESWGPLPEPPVVILSCEHFFPKPVVLKNGGSEYCHLKFLVVFIVKEHTLLVLYTEIDGNNLI